MSYTNHIIQFGLNKFLASFLGTEKFLSGSTRSLSYTDHIIQFGLNKFLAPLAGTEKFLSGSTRSLSYIDHIIQFVLTLVLLEWDEEAHWGLCSTMPHVSAGKG